MSKNITEIIRQISEQNMPHIVAGYIAETNPLQVVLVDDMNITLSDQSVIIPSEKQPLNKGDYWYLLSVNKNKVYYFLDKV